MIIDEWRFASRASSARPPLAAPRRLLERPRRRRRVRQRVIDHALAWRRAPRRPTRAAATAASFSAVAAAAALRACASVAHIAAAASASEAARRRLTIRRAMAA